MKCHVNHLSLVTGNEQNPEEAKAFVEAVASKLPSSDLVEAGIAAPALDLTTVLAAAKGSNLKVAAQNCYFEMQVLSLVKQAHKF